MGPADEIEARRALAMATRRKAQAEQAVIDGDPEAEARLADAARAHEAAREAWMRARLAQLIGPN